MDQNKSNSSQDLNNYRNGTNERYSNSNNSDISDINNYRPNGTDFDVKSGNNTEDINNYRPGNPNSENFTENSNVWEKIKENRSEDFKNDYYKDKDINNENDFWDSQLMLKKHVENYLYY